MKVSVVIPVQGSDAVYASCRSDYRAYASSGTELRFVALTHGTPEIISWTDQALNEAEILQLVLDEHAQGADAIVIACTGDPGLRAARELVPIPVIGEGIASITVGALVSDGSFSIVIPSDEGRAFMKAAAKAAGFAHALASVRPVPGYGVLDFDEAAVEDVVATALQAIHDDGADAIVLGCTGVGTEMGGRVSSRLQEELGVYVPVVDPAGAGIGLAELLVRNGLAQSARTYPTPLVTRLTPTRSCS